MNINEKVSEAKSKVRDFFAIIFEFALLLLLLGLAYELLVHITKMYEIEATLVKILIYIAILLVLEVIITPLWIMLDMRVLIIDIHNRLENLEKERENR